MVEEMVLEMEETAATAMEGMKQMIHTRTICVEQRGLQPCSPARSPVLLGLIAQVVKHVMLPPIVIN